MIMPLSVRESYADEEFNVVPCIGIPSVMEFLKCRNVEEKKEKKVPENNITLKLVLVLQLVSGNEGLQILVLNFGC